MAYHKTHNNKGVAYIAVIAILGLLAFMGLFLMQSSNIEYSQTSLSVYRTMGRQLAEAAAEEAAVIIEERLKDKSSSGLFQKLLNAAATSKVKRLYSSSSSAELNLLVSNLHKSINQTLNLKDGHVSRAGFNITKVLPTIIDLRPIPQGPLDFDSCYYRPTDRNKGFDNEFSKDWYCTLQIDVTLTLEKHNKISINYQLSKDIKLLNLGPIARNYTYYNMLGCLIKSGENTVAAITNQLNLSEKESGSFSSSAKKSPGGRLILWNQPFQSRVFMHGPAIINLENPQLTDSQYKGAYNTFGNGSSCPGPNQAYQYSKTFYGLSYFPTVKRCLFPSKGFTDIFSAWFSTTPTMGDANTNNVKYDNTFKDETVCGGFLPERDSSLISKIGGLFTDGASIKHYYVGTNISQKFLPAGPYCRVPWRFVPTTPPAGEYKPVYLPNRLDAEPPKFPETEAFMTIEHRWDPNNDETAENTKIYANTYHIKYNPVTGNVNGGDQPQSELLEFSLSYHNDPDPDSILGKLWSSISSLGEGLWNTVTLPFQLTGNLASPLIDKIKNYFSDPDKPLNGDEEAQFANLFPTNYKYEYKKMATRRFESEKDIPKDSEGRWILNGVYWLDRLNIEAPIVYIGTGTLMVCRYTKGKPVTINGDVFAYRSSPGGPPQGHLNIFYHPFLNTSKYDFAEDKMLHIGRPDNNSGITIEASVYSCYGIRSYNSEGNISDFPEYGMDPSMPLDKWDSLDSILKKTNTIFGNYVNCYMNLYKQYDDLWVIHNYQNQFYYKPSDSRYYLTQEFLDYDEKERKAFEINSHYFFMSPKIQHIGVRGSL